MRSLKDSYWKSWTKLHTIIFSDGSISDSELLSLTMDVKELTISIIDKLSEIEKHHGLATKVIE